MTYNVFSGTLNPTHSLWAEAYLHTMWHLNPSSHLSTIDMGGKLGAVPLWGRVSSVLIQHNVARAETYLHAKFHLDPCNRLATVHNVTDRTDNGLIA